MSFQRARSKEQKDQRLEEIIEVTCKQYERTNYDKISMASIAKELSFTRGNLYKYAATKEEIFLLVLSNDQKNWSLDILNELEGKTNMDIKSFAKVWAEVYYRHKRLLSLYALLMTIIEKNVSIESLTQFKIDFFQATMPIYEKVIDILPFLSDKRLFKFYNMQFHYLRGLYPATQDNELQKEASRKSGIPYTTLDFVESFEEYVVMNLTSIKNGVI